MSPTSADKRIALSDAVITVYERDAAYPSLNADIQYRLETELKALGALAFEHPHQAPRINRLVSRYHAISVKLAAERLGKLAGNKHSATTPQPQATH